LGDIKFGSLFLSPGARGSVPGSGIVLQAEGRGSSSDEVDFFNLYLFLPAALVTDRDYISQITVTLDIVLSHVA
jgi:hypothetical protein